MVPSTEETEQLRQLEEQLLQVDTRHSPDKLATLLAEEFLEYGVSGESYNKAQAIKTLGASSTSTQINLSEFSVKRLAKNLVLVTYRSEKRGEGIETQHALRSSIWRQTRNGWRILFHQATPCK